MTFKDLLIDTLKEIIKYLTIWDMQQFRMVSRMFEQIYNEYYLPNEKNKIKDNNDVNNMMKMFIYLNQQNIGIKINHLYDECQKIIHNITCDICNNDMQGIYIKDIKNNFYIKCCKCNNKMIITHKLCYIKYIKIYICIPCFMNCMIKILLKYKKYTYHKMDLFMMKIFINVIIRHIYQKEDIRNYISEFIREEKSTELYNEIMEFLDLL